MPDMSDRTRGRVCLWVTENEEWVALTVDGWNADHELTTVAVRYLGPFDNLLEAIKDGVDILTAQQSLF